MMTPARTAAAILLLPLFAASCSLMDDGGATGVEHEDDDARADADVGFVLACEADTRAGTLACEVPDPDAGLGDGASGLVVGGQDLYVTLESSGVCYEDDCSGGSAGDENFQADVTVENLIPQALGTADGEAGHDDGVRVFFHSGPTVTVGSGTVEIVNADGTATFLTADQPYFQYGGTAGSELGSDGLLSENETSDARTWRWNVPSSVDEFEFEVYVSAEVQHPDGWVEIDGLDDRLSDGSTDQLSATVYDVVGNEVAGRTITWSSADAEVATVDASGLVTGDETGLAEITASSDGPEASGTTTANVNVVLVDHESTASGSGADGLTWESAYNNLLSPMLGADAGLEFWVTGGTYTPASAFPGEEDTFKIQNDIRVYGGFAGTETRRHERDYAANETVLSGDVDDDGTSSGNSYHVVTIDGTTANGPITESTILDGFTITGGNADGSGDDSRGGGIFCDGRDTGHECSPTLLNLKIVDNYASLGGGMYTGGSGGDSSPLVANVVFSDNTANSGGAYAHAGEADGAGGNEPRFVNVTFSRNEIDVGTNGGAIFNNGGHVTLRNSILWDNNDLGGNNQIYTRGSSGTTDLAYTVLEGGIDGDGVTAEDGGEAVDNGEVWDIDPEFQDNLRLGDGAVDLLDVGDNGAVPADVSDLDGDGDTDEPLPLDLDGVDRFASATVDPGAYEKP
ncbi:MAG: Ig-like domain-containing protein [Gemmatimonadota bacterium]